MKVLALSVLCLYGLVGLGQGDRRCHAVSGYCQLTSTRCDGTYSRGMCNGPANRQCCRPNSNGDTRCRAANGYCQLTSSRCDGTYTPGMCNGPANRQCCRPSANADRYCAERSGTCKYGTCPEGNFVSNLCSGPVDRRCCVSLPQSRGDIRCRAVNGYCQLTSTRCDGTYTPGMCNGPANRQCCRPSANADRSCAARGGTCKYGTCPGGNFISNLCSGPVDRRCCVSLIPQPDGDARCTSRQGRCQPRSNRCSPGGYVRGLCTGTNVCCMGKRYRRCELVRALRARNMPGNLADWICLAYHESKFRTYAVGRRNSNGSRDWGLYQFNDNFWCKSKRQGHSNNCELYCWDVLKADITESTNYAKIVYRAQGFSAWYAWRDHCRGRDLSAYVRGC